jgi:hypothetical protein
VGKDELTQILKEEFTKEILVSPSHSLILERRGWSKFLIKTAKSITTSKSALLMTVLAPHFALFAVPFSNVFVGHLGNRVSKSTSLIEKTDKFFTNQTSKSYTESHLNSRREELLNQNIESAVNLWFSSINDEKVESKVKNDLAQLIWDRIYREANTENEAQIVLNKVIEKLEKSAENAYKENLDKILEKKIEALNEKLKNVSKEEEKATLEMQLEDAEKAKKQLDNYNLEKKIEDLNEKLKNASKDRKNTLKNELKAAKEAKKQLEDNLKKLSNSKAEIEKIRNSILSKLYWPLTRTNFKDKSNSQNSFFAAIGDNIFGGVGDTKLNFSEPLISLLGVTAAGATTLLSREKEEKMENATISLQLLKLGAGPEINHQSPLFAA